ncbi:MAG: hypothetical protein A3A80_01600 [Candidatus Terrybacteria bacterium RIFCSPLOWO2_01_FULL_44_24]|uniref:Uncharacterized protein n=1 Tax=Candidatus Terrybacteria bacterium RIFCSPHIGHO2_01_FULL_43_35 TaxID=1802361 RepID=A0A1G2PFM6_9BACT|nr:MAG: hypothetical protein A2828_03975 [Candidatus Terrybacteria bacterium RIFCSPHIGHO2_01_FULL_43_35]OHA49907.1 MAG: hypothetical protein A3B75_03325 [Candidatus Terrybacteria bacterium RIFCSPHIGHO2_02_FULL_43_14]OHA51772.1 MAG: hypothetical protein A3A80_01600 [Candidatus Terrybacteria bacterium RIFCSPLOWO2_01_FULL_44_24]
MRDIAKIRSLKTSKMDVEMSKPIEAIPEVLFLSTGEFGIITTSSEELFVRLFLVPVSPPFEVNKLITLAADQDEKDDYEAVVRAEYIEQNDSDMRYVLLDIKIDGKSTTYLLPKTDLIDVLADNEDSDFVFDRVHTGFRWNSDQKQFE